MNLYIRAHRIGWLWLIAAAVGFSAGLSELSLALPQLNGIGSMLTSLNAVIPLALSTAAIYCLSQTDRRLAHAGVRRTELMDLVMVIVVPLCLVATLAAIAQGAGVHGAAATARNAMFYLGVALLVFQFSGVGWHATGFPFCWLVLSVALGRPMGRYEPIFAAVPVATPSNLGSWACAFLVLLAAVIITLRGQSSRVLTRGEA